LDLSSIVKSYDIRGVVPEELDERIARALGAAFVRVLETDRVVTAHDMRATSVPLARAFAEGAMSQGADVVEAGLGSTDLLYFASGHLGLPGAMVTASHNPAQYNGFKLCGAGATPVGADNGLDDIRAVAEEHLAAGTPSVRHDHLGRSDSLDLLPAYAEHLRSLVDLTGIRPLTAVVDAGNGMAGHTVPAVLAGLPVTVVGLYFELDGSFPNHPANPLDPENLADLRAAVPEHEADLGLAFDGDADRCFVVDERGEVVSPSAIAALIAVRELSRCPGATVVHNAVTSRVVSEVVTEHGGTPVPARVGHSYMKQEMARTDAVFGAEHSAHYYFRDFWRADTGMLAALHVLAALGSQDRTLSALAAGFSRYAASGEVNSRVADQAAAIAAVEAAFAGRPGVRIDHLDGTTVELPDGSWFNVRGSGTEPLLRLNVEAPDHAAVAALRDAVLALVRR